MTEPEFIHLVVECSKLAYADREKFYGDPDFVEVPMTTLLSDAYNAERRKLVAAQGLAGTAAWVGRRLWVPCVKLRREEGQRRATSARLAPVEPTVGRHGRGGRGDTVHFDIIDQAGNMVSSTPSGGWLQSSPVIPELGFCLGTRAQMFWLEEGHPASLAPGKRPRTTLSPTLALRDGEAVHGMGFARRRSAGSVDHAVLCAPRSRQAQLAGSDRRAGVAFRTLSDLVLAAHGTSRRAAGRRAACRRRRATSLRRRGHIIEIEPDWSEGRLTAASRLGPRRRAAANPRGMQGYAAGR